MADFGRMDWFQALVKKDPAAVKKWVDATYRNQKANAMGPLAGYPVAQQMAGALSDLTLNLQGQAFKNVIDYENAKKQQQAQLLADFAQADKNVAGERASSDAQMAALAQQLGIGGPSPQQDQNNRLLDQLSFNNQQARNANLAGFNTLGNMYDDLNLRQAQGYDVFGAQNLAAIYDAILAQKAAAAGSGGGGSSGGGGGGGGGGSRKKKSSSGSSGSSGSGPTGLPLQFSDKPTAFGAKSPYMSTTPLDAYWRESTRGSGYVKPDVPIPARTRLVPPPVVRTTVRPRNAPNYRSKANYYLSKRGIQ